MNRYIGAGPILVLTLGIGGQAVAQPSHQDIELRGYVGVGGGIALPVGDFGDVTKLGWIIHAKGGYTMRGGTWGGRIDASFSQNELDLASGNVRAFGATANLVLTPGPRPADFHPYFFAGAGGYRVKRTAVDGEWALALNGGAGIQLHIGRRVDVFVEGRWLHLTTDNSINMVPLTAGFRWGGI